LAAASTGGKDEWMDLMRDMVMGCEQTAQEMERQFGRLGVSYRFSVEQGLQRIYGEELEKHMDQQSKIAMEQLDSCEYYRKSRDYAT
jgi:hypothetical protein